MTAEEVMDWDIPFPGKFEPDHNQRRNDLIRHENLPIARVPPV